MLYRILADQPNGGEFECFIWSRAPQAGVEQAKRDARRFGNDDLSNFRAEPLKGDDE